MFAAQDVVAHSRRLRLASELIEPRKRVHRIKKDATDNHILACALEAKADFLVTGDKKHILPLKKIGATRIVSPAEFLHEVFGS